MIGKATYKHGEVSKTYKQKKKHISQMNDREKNILKEKVNSLDWHKTEVSYHLQKKIDSGELDFSGAHLIRLFENYEIIEYNQTRGENRVLLRGKKVEIVWCDGAFETANLCVVLSFDTNRIITAYWNNSEDDHKTIDFSRYSKRLKIKF